MDRPELEIGDWVRHGTGAGTISLFLGKVHAKESVIRVYDTRLGVRLVQLDTIDVVWRCKKNHCIWNSDGRDYNAKGQPR